MIYSHLTESFIPSVVLLILLLIILVCILIGIVLKTMHSLSGVLQKVVFRYIPITVISIAAFLVINTLCSNMYCFYIYKTDPIIAEGNISIDNIEEVRRMGSDSISYHIGFSINDIAFDISNSNLYKKETIDSIADHCLYRVIYIIVDNNKYIWDIEIIE